MSDSKNSFGAEKIFWDLSDLYESTDSEKLENDKKEVKQLADDFAVKYRTRIKALTPKEFSAALQELEKIYDTVGRMNSFAYLIWSTNTEESRYGKLVSELTELSSQIQQKLVFFDVEWLEIDEEEAIHRINDESLSHYRHYLEASRRFKPYILEEKQEQVISAKSVTSREAWVRFFDETMGAARFALDGETLTEQEVLSKLHDSDRELRKRAAESLTNTFKTMSRSLTYIFNTILADKNINDTLRKYPSWISSRNLSNEIDDETVDTLIQSVTDQYKLVQRFYKLKKKITGLRCIV